MQGKHHYEQELFHYLDIESFIPQNHLLRKIDKLIDLSFVDELTEPFYCKNNERPSIDPKLFFRLILVGYLYNIESDRQLCDEVQYNLAYRWFCNLNLEDKVPDHSSLTRIRDRLGLEVFNQFFIKITEFCKQIGLVKGERIMTDGTLFEANASINSLVLKNSNDIPNKETSNEAVSSNTKRTISNNTHISKTDPDATFAFKSGTARNLKYKAHITIDADTRVVLDAKVTTGATQESQIYLGRINVIEDTLGLKIKRAIADRAYGTGKIFQSLIDKHITPNIALLNDKSGKACTPEGFIYDKNNNCYRCPADKLLYPYPTINNETYHYHSKPADCKACIIKNSCTASLTNNGRVRRITRHIHNELFNKVREWMTQEIFQNNLLERRWKMEGLISEAKNLHCLSRAKYRGLKKTQIQAYMVASALNLKRLVAFLIPLIIIVNLFPHFLRNIKRFILLVHCMKLYSMLFQQPASGI